MKKIAFGCDHVGFMLKEDILAHLRARGIDVVLADLRARGEI